MDSTMGDIKYVQLEAGDFLSDPDFQLMNSTERGIYCSVIFYMYGNDGRIKNDPERIEKLCNAEENFEKSWETVQKKFAEKNGYLTHKRVRKELAKAKRFMQHQRMAGLASAKARQPRLNHGSTTVKPPMQPNKVKESKVKESKEKEKEKEREREKDFEKFRKAYPGRKRGLDEEWSNFQKHKDWEEVSPLLISALEQQIVQRAKDAAVGKFIPPWKNLTTWLNQRCWTEQAGVTESPESKEEKEQVEIGREREKIRKDYEQYYQERSDKELQDCLKVEHINYTHGWLIEETLASRRQG